MLAPPDTIPLQTSEPQVFVMVTQQPKGHADWCTCAFIIMRLTYENHSWVSVVKLSIQEAKHRKLQGAQGNVLDCNLPLMNLTIKNAKPPCQHSFTELDNARHRYHVSDSMVKNGRVESSPLLPSQL
jgi:hypothetical protein